MSLSNTFQVIEVINADALVVKTPDGSSKKLFLSSLRPPRLPTREDGSQVLQDAGARCWGITASILYKLFTLNVLVFQEQTAGNKRTRPLYDVPYMFEAREFMRKKLIGKKVFNGLNV